LNIEFAIFIEEDLAIAYITPPSPEYSNDLEKKQLIILIF